MMKHNAEAYEMMTVIRVCLKYFEVTRARTFSMRRS